MDEFAKKESENPQFESSQFQEPPSQNPQSEYDTSYPRPQKRRRLLYLLAAVLLILVLFNVVRTLTAKKETSPTPTPTPSIETVVEENVPKELQETPTPTPTPTPAATPKASVDPVDKITGLDRSKLSVSVQNGSGEAGVAKKGSDFLKGLGYNVTLTGNADNFDYKNVTVKVKTSQKDYLPLLVKDLNASYLVAASSSDLSATASADALVIIGK